MRMTNEEIAEALEHQRNILRVLRKRLQQRELQEAQFGINVPPEITSDIDALTERIHLQEAEIARLETVAVEDQLSLTEAQYKVLLAEVFDTPRGRPTVAGAARLEFERLKMGLPLERAQLLEREVRSGLVRELFFDVCFDDFSIFFLKEGNVIGPTVDMQNNSSSPNVYINERPLLILGRMIRLDHVTAVTLFLELLSPPIYEIDMANFKKAMYDVNRVRNYLGDRILFDEFFSLLSTLYAQKQVLVASYTENKIPSVATEQENIEHDDSP